MLEVNEVIISLRVHRAEVNLGDKLSDSFMCRNKRPLAIYRD